LEFCIRGLLTEQLSSKVMLDYKVFMSSVCSILATKAISQICEETSIGEGRWHLWGCLYENRDEWTNHHSYRLVFPSWMSLTPRRLRLEWRSNCQRPKPIQSNWQSETQVSSFIIQNSFRYSSDVPHKFFETMCWGKKVWPSISSLLRWPHSTIWGCGV